MGVQTFIKNNQTRYLAKSWKDKLQYLERQRLMYKEAENVKETKQSLVEENKQLSYGEPTVIFSRIALV